MKKKPVKNNAKDKLSKKLVQVSLPRHGRQTLPAGQALTLAKQWLEQNQLLAAINLLSEITQQIPNLTSAWLLLFDALHRQGNFQRLSQESLRCLQQIPRFVPALVCQGTSLRLLQQHPQALVILAKATKLEPSNPEVWNHIGIVHKEMGDADSAKAAFQRCLAIKPDHTGAIWNRSDLVEPLTEDEYKGYIQLINRKKKPREKAMLHYALARSCEQQEQFAQEFDHVQQGAALMRQVAHYDHAANMQLFDDIVTTFTADSGEIKSADKTPVFICGLPRSGTTLVEQILSSHPQVTAGDELTNLPLACEQLIQAKKINQPYPFWVPELSPDDWQQIGATYLRSTEFLQSGSHFTDKNLMNFKAVGLIRRALPQAKIIICERNPMDTVWANYRQYFSEGLQFTYYLEELARLCKATHELTTHWQRIGSPIFVVRYEQLVANSIKTIRELINFVGLEWDDACLDFHTNERAVRTTSAVQVRQPLSQSNLNRWQRYEAQLAGVKAIFE